MKANHENWTIQSPDPDVKNEWKIFLVLWLLSFLSWVPVMKEKEGRDSRNDNQ